ncbi:MAG: F420-0-gamma-glutamyl ligase [Parcubacteria group bacterium GW2011_GWA1_33_6]|uniref:N-acetyltransferase domain-containing protein n=1 Tax=Candidatus Staskawiczbacteria bacterium RIFCSPHIGHO2_02_FULL_33_16 TaxID=1802204 RepID=A0A1G2HSU0_9BACT|nr:MAG: F420-0-gamma-glutamyl ligase [Parcubacteria group bacterium GW2011_GWA2_33_14]KKP54983.1 MAG: F420-0-gamma-glutamyl ligase [Parcubacteria group bacterium GW2011_GWA1_33_6]OGZ65469.1 MAG: hypothetical protein A3D34_03045 [Candidatus Staskawiczbacteria bacterium RIFCSPHIGHO2_02_FULL_33_16]OGZ69986.1 MAG: hypothetical protein A2980_03400 [Candidatus Staskawiczbacteria bacterium RIFCSPLOWO2_01_FULL_33_13]
MEILPNKEKNLIAWIGGRSFARYPIKTKLITPEDKDISLIVAEYTKKYLKPQDIVFVSEKAVAISQGRAYNIKDIKASYLARFLSSFVIKTPIGIGLGSPETMQLALEEVGVVRILIASFFGALGKLVGVKGLFYIVAGNGARSIDGAVSYAIPPYNNYVSKGPQNANEVASIISKKIGVPVAIVDANDIGINILGATYGVDKKLVAKIIKDNPLGQSDEQTPIGIIREMDQEYSYGPVRRATLADLNSITSVATLLHIDVPGFIWNSPEFIEKQIHNREYFVMEQNGVVVGIMSLRQRNYKMHIETLVVKNEFQSKGFGTLFIEFAKQNTKERGLATLHAYSFLKYNMAEFYLKKGFTMLEYLGNYQGLQYHCFEMKLS